VWKTAVKSGHRHMVAGEVWILPGRTRLSPRVPCGDSRVYPEATDGRR
jgi:hypothetical protein